MVFEIAADKNCDDLLTISCNKLKFLRKMYQSNQQADVLCIRKAQKINKILNNNIQVVYIKNSHSKVAVIYFSQYK